MSSGRSRNAGGRTLRRYNTDRKRSQEPMLVRYLPTCVSAATRSSVRCSRRPRQNERDLRDEIWRLFSSALRRERAKSSFRSRAPILSKQAVPQPTRSRWISTAAEPLGYGAPQRWCNCIARVATAAAGRLFQLHSRISHQQGQNNPGGDNCCRDARSTAISSRSQLKARIARRVVV